MIYLSGDGCKIIILETANLDALKEGDFQRTGDGSVVIGWTPDAAWLAEQLLKSCGNLRDIAALIEEASRRPEQPARPYHKPLWHEFP